MCTIFVRRKLGRSVLFERKCGSRNIHLKKETTVPREHFCELCRKKGSNIQKASDTENYKHKTGDALSRRQSPRMSTMAVFESMERLPYKILFDGSLIYRQLSQIIISEVIALW